MPEPDHHQPRPPKLIAARADAITIGRYDRVDGRASVDIAVMGELTPEGARCFAQALLVAMVGHGRDAIRVVVLTPASLALLLSELTARAASLPRPRQALHQSWRVWPIAVASAVGVASPPDGLRVVFAWELHWR